MLVVNSDSGDVMKNLWKFINSPIVVVIIALIIWPALFALTSSFAFDIGIREVVSSVQNEVSNSFQELNGQQTEKRKIEAEVIERLELDNVKLVPTPFPATEKVIGSITNTSDMTVSRVQLTASYFNSLNELIDVGNQWLEGTASLRPGETRDFTFHRNFGGRGTTEPPSESEKTASVKLVVVRLGQVE